MQVCVSHGQLWGMGYYNMHIYIHTYMHIYNASAFACTHTHTHTYIYIYTHTYIHTYNAGMCIAWATLVWDTTWTRALILSGKLAGRLSRCALQRTK